MRALLKARDELIAIHNDYDFDEQGEGVFAHAIELIDETFETLESCRHHNVTKAQAQNENWRERCLDS